MDTVQSGLTISVVLMFVTPADTCPTFRMKWNISYDPNSCQLSSLQSEVEGNECIRMCNQPSCTGVIAAEYDSTTWCCLMDQDPILIGPGNFVLYYNKDYTAGCLFGFDEECSGCITDRMWYGFYGSSNPTIYVNFRITFSGHMCSTISGVVLNAGSETAIESGELDRVNKRWRFTAVPSAGSVFEADLDDNGDMKDGSITQPSGTIFVYYATYSSG